MLCNELLGFFSNKRVLYSLCSLIKFLAEMFTRIKENEYFR